jgi:hypothetical protein
MSSICLRCVAERGINWQADILSLLHLEVRYTVDVSFRLPFIFRHHSAPPIYANKALSLVICISSLHSPQHLVIHLLIQYPSIRLPTIACLIYLFYVQLYAQVKGNFEASSILSHLGGCCQNHAEIESSLASCYTRILASGIFGSECVKLFARDKIISKYGSANHDVQHRNTCQ